MAVSTLAQEARDGSAGAPAGAAGQAGGAWRLALAVAALAAVAVGLIHRETVAGMVAIWWRSDTFAHGFLILPISLYMLWTRRGALAALSPVPAWSGLALMALLSAGWLLAWLVDVLVIQQLAVVAMLPALALTVLGWRVAWAMAFPLAYLFFMVPMGEGLEAPMMDQTARFAVWALDRTGIPVYQEGRFITIPTGNWEVAQACSGLRYLIASVAVGCLYAYLTYRSLWRRAAFVALSIVLPVLANWVRAYGIIMMGHLSDMRLAVGADHLVYGWVFFGFMMVLMFWIGSLWREPDGGPDAAPVAPPGAPRAVAARPVATVVAGACAVALVLAAPLAARGLPDGAPGGVARLVLPPAEGGWSGPLPPAEPWTPGFVDPDATAHADYRLGGERVTLFAVFYRREEQGEELIGSQNRLYGGGEWSRLGETRRTVSLPDGARFTVEERLLALGAVHRVAWAWYDVDGRTTANPMVGKLWQGIGRLTGAGAGSFVALAADYEGVPTAARATLEAFLRANPGLARPGAIRPVAAGAGSGAAR